MHFRIQNTDLEKYKQTGAELCQTQVKLCYPASSHSIALKLFFPFEMFKIIKTNKIFLFILFQSGQVVAGWVGRREK